MALSVMAQLQIEECGRSTESLECMVVLTTHFDIQLLRCRALVIIIDCISSQIMCISLSVLETTCWTGSVFRYGLNRHACTCILNTFTLEAFRVFSASSYDIFLRCGVLMNWTVLFCVLCCHVVKFY